MLFSKPKKKKTKEELSKEREDLLRKCGYSALKAKHGKALRPDFPNLKVDERHPLSNNIDRNGLHRKSGAEHPDALQFPVCQNHKQGPTLLTGFDDITYAGGKKT